MLEGRNGYLYGRGASDNKGPVLAAMYAVADLVAERCLHCDVVFVLEGEEESDSRGFEATVRKHKDLIGPIDWILLANSYWLNDDFPCLTYGLRGVIRASLTVQGGQRDLHSGVDGSHLVHEPLKDLLGLVSSIAKPNGHIPLRGFYDQVLKSNKADETRYAALGEFLFDNLPEEDMKGLKAKWQEPSLTVHGFTSSSSGKSTVIPHKASASLSLRLVPNQSASVIQKSLVEFLEKRWEELGSRNTLSITTGQAVDPWLGDPDNDIYRVLERAVVEAWGLEGEEVGDVVTEDSTPAPGKSSAETQRRSSTNHKSRPSATKHQSKKGSRPSSDLSSSTGDRKKGLLKPLYIREGGSIPVIRFLEKEFDAPAAQLPCGQSTDNAHLDNERLRLLNLYNSRKIFRKVFEELA